MYNLSTVVLSVFSFMPWDSQIDAIDHLVPTSFFIFLDLFSGVWSFDLLIHFMCFMCLIILNKPHVPPSQYIMMFVYCWIVAANIFQKINIFPQ